MLQFAFTPIKTKARIQRTPDVGFWIVQRAVPLACVALICLQIGCGTTIKRVATEQLIMSDAIDRAIAQIDFNHLRGQHVYLDTQYIKPSSSTGLVNSDYVVSSLRQQLTAAHCLIQDTAEEADIIVEPRLGTLGTDGTEIIYGIPQSGAVNTAAATLSNQPFASIPEISVGKNHAQTAIAKVIVFAYDRHTREPVWQSGIAKAESNSKDTWILGAGPFQKGSIYQGTRFAGKSIPTPIPSSHQKIESFAGPQQIVTFDNEYTFKNGNRPLKPLQPVATEHRPTVENVSAPGNKSVDAASYEEAIGK